MSKGRQVGCGILVVCFLIFGVISFLKENPWAWLVVIPVCALVVWWWVSHRKEQHRVSLSLAQIDAMDGSQFEHYLVNLFSRLGYRAEHTGHSGDFGADLIIEKDGMRTAVQAKNYDSSSVGNEAVQQAIAAAAYYDCQKAMVVTNSTFTVAANQQAAGSNLPVGLVDRKGLAKLIHEVE